MANEKPYKQGFNESTGDIVIVCSPEDVQDAIADYFATPATANSRDELQSVTRERAIELMKANEKALTTAYQIGLNGEWMQSIQDVLGDQVSEAELTDTVPR